MATWPFTKGLHDLGHGGFAWLQPDGGYGLSNAGLIVDSGQALLVDTLTNLPLTQEMLDAMRAQVPASRQIGSVVNTHAHPDHTAGNLLLEGAEIITSVATADEMLFIDSDANPMKRMLANWQQFGEPGAYMHEVMGRFNPHADKQLMPTRTFEDSLSLSVGNKRLELLKVGPAHTKGDTLVYVPEDKLLFTGDVLFHQVHPLVMPGAASLWIAACERILGWDVEVVVPGHGPVTDKAGVRGLRDYLLFFRDQARQRYDAGMGYEEATRDIALDAFRGWADEERIFATVANFFTEFGAKPVPMPEVMTVSARYRKAMLARCSEHGEGCSGHHG